MRLQLCVPGDAESEAVAGTIRAVLHTALRTHLHLRMLDTGNAASQGANILLGLPTDDVGWGAPQQKKIDGHQRSGARRLEGVTVADAENVTLQPQRLLEVLGGQAGPWRTLLTG